MPTYEYRCRACGHRFERFQRMSEEPVRICPACGKRQAERLIGAGGGFVFKGPGFYATDYRSPASRAEGDSRKKEEGTGGGAGDSSEKGSGDSAARPGGDPSRRTSASDE